MNTIHSMEMKEFNQLYREADHIYSRYAASQGISPTMLCILYSLYTEGSPCTQTKLVEDWCIPMQTVNSCLKSMEQSGIVRLEFAEGNRKSKRILFSDKGKELADRIIAPLVKAENQALEALGAEQQRQLLALTQKHTGLLHNYLFGQK